MPKVDFNEAVWQSAEFWAKDRHTEYFMEKGVCGIPCLFSDLRINKDSAPLGFSVLEIKLDDDGYWEKLECNVPDECFGGSVLVPEDLKDVEILGYSYTNEEPTINYLY